MKKYWASAIKNKSFGKWLPQEPTGPVTEYVPVTDEQIIGEILDHPNLEDRGFFEDMVAWLRMDAPRRLRGMLEDLFPWKTSADFSYERLCEAVYRMGFRASKILERRMILGTSNEWVRKYFEDFPIKGDEK